VRRHPFACSVCRETVQYRDQQYEERIELRNTNRSESFASKTTAYYCKNCMIARRDELKGVTAAQESLI